MSWVMLEATEPANQRAEPDSVAATRALLDALRRRASDTVSLAAGGRRCVFRL
jgi:hypothetical protein